MNMPRPRPIVPAILILLAPILTVGWAGAQDTAADVVGVTLNAEELRLAPGEPGSFIVTIQNPGDRQREVVLETTYGPTIASFRVSPEEQKLIIPAAGHQAATVRVTPLPGTGGGNEAGFHFTVRDADAPGVTYGRADALVRVVTLQMEVTPALAYMQPGETGTLQVTLRNPNAHVVSTHLQGKVDPPTGWRMRSLSEELLDLPPDASITREITYGPAPDAPEGARATFRFAAFPAGGAGAYASAESQAEILREAEPGPGTDGPQPVVDPPSAFNGVRAAPTGTRPAAVTPGDGFTLTYEVFNDGNEAVRLRFAMQGTAQDVFTVSLEPETLLLDARGRAEVKVEVVTAPDVGTTVAPVGDFQVLTVEGALIVALNTPPVFVEALPHAVEAWVGAAAAYAEAHPVAAGGVAVTATAGLAGAGTFIWRRREDLTLGGLAPMLGLFTRLTKPDVLKHEVRDKIFAAIRENPGTTFSELKTRFELNTGAIMHHLRTLEQHKFITSRREGSRRRFYPVGERLPEPESDPVTPMQARILALLDERPLPQQEVAERLGLTRQGANYHVKTLERKGHVAFEQQDGRWVCVRVRPTPMPPGGMDATDGGAEA